MESSSLAERKPTPLSMNSAQARRPDCTSAGLGPARMPITSPASFVEALAAPAYRERPYTTSTAAALVASSRAQ